MRKSLKWIIRIALGFLGFIVLMMVVGFIMLNTSWLQNKLLTGTVELLEDKLQTNVEVDSVSIDLFTLDAKLYGLRVDDLQRRKMLQMEFLKADVDVFALLNGEVCVNDARVKGLSAELHKLPKDTLSPDTVANYQFILDAFKSDKAKKKKKTPSQKGLALVMDMVAIERVHVKFNEDSVSLGKLRLSIPRKGASKGKIENLKACWSRVNKKGENVTNEALVTLLEFKEKDGEQLIDLRRVNFKTNNHRPRKNAAKPKRGFFDVGHFNIWADMKLAIDHIENGTVHGWLREMTACDTITGLDIRKLQCEVTANKDGMRLEDVQIQQGDIALHFVRGDMSFPNKKTGKKLKYFTSTIGGTAYLKDISRPFAPVLKNFKHPLTLSVRMDGDDEGMRFHDVVVTSPGDKLVIKATGFITGLKDKYKLNVHFDVKSMTAQNSEIFTIINQFSVKKFFMKQLKQLGTVHYNGSFDVLWKKEQFRGMLNTKAGNINFNLTLDENNKYLTGRAIAQRIEIGKVMDMPKIGPVSVTADFKFDYSKPRTALMRRKLGGKLPIGDVKAVVEKASYGPISISDVDVKIVSNGAIAEGSLSTPGKFADLSCNFSFTSTDDMHKMKIKPHVKVNFFGLFGKSSSATPEQKAKEQAEKDAQEAQEEQDKAARKALKEKEKAEKKAEKAARKAAKAQEKAARKAAKAQEKAARKAAKEAEKTATKTAEET